MAKAKKGMSAGTVAAFGASAAALGGAAYYLLGPDSKKHQKMAKKWAQDAEKIILKEASRAKDISEAVIRAGKKEYTKEAPRIKREIQSGMRRAKGEVSRVKKVVSKLRRKAR